MGTFLKVVGIIVVVLGVVVVVASLLGVGSWFSFTRAYPMLPEEAPPNYWQGFWLLGGIGGVFAGLGVLIAGVALFCLGSIYNDVKSLKR